MWDHGLFRLDEVEPELLRVGLFLLAGVAVGLAATLRRAAGTPGTSRWVLALLLSVFLGAGLFTYFAPGDVAGGDAHAHLARTWLYGEAFASEKTFPIWTNRWYLGYPLGLHYGVLYFASSGFWSAVLPFDFSLETKLFLWVCHVLSGLIVFFYTRVMARSSAAGIVGAVVYTFSFQHLGPLLLSGQLPLGLVFVLLPAVLLVFEYWDRGRLSHRAAATLVGLGLALSFLNHLQYGLYTALAVAVYLFVRIAWSWVAGHERRVHVRGRILFGLSTLLVTVLLSAWFVLPAMLEGGDLVLSSSDRTGELLGEFSLSGLRNAADLLLWSRIMRDWSYYYVGLVPLALALLSVAQLRRNSGGELVTLWVSGLCFLGLALLNPRFSLFWFFFLAVLAGCGASAWLELLRHRTLMARVLPYLLVLTLLADLGPALIQSPYRPLDNGSLAKLQRDLDERRDIGRILELGAGKSTLWRSLDVVETGCSTPFGGIPQAATKLLPYSAAIAGAAVRELITEEGELSATTRDALRLLHVDYLRLPGPNPDQMRTVELDGYPVWFAPRIERADDVDPIESIDWYSMKTHFDRGELDSGRTLEAVGRMEVDPEKPVLGRILLHRTSPVLNTGPSAESNPTAGPSAESNPTAEPSTESNPTAEPSAEPNPNADPNPTAEPNPNADPIAVPAGHPVVIGSGASFEILEEEQTSQSVRVRYRSAEAGYLLLSYAYSPRLRAELDGLRTQTYRSSLYLTVVSTPAGEHWIELRPGVSGLRRWLIWLAVISCLVLGLLALSPGRRRSGGTP